MIRFTVLGTPVAQGSKIVTRTGFMYEANKQLKPWRDTVTAAAMEARDGAPPLIAPVRVIVTFAFPRPKSHYRTGRNAALLRDSAPLWHAQKPDADKCQRALGDALVVAGVLRDDSLIAAWSVDKVWDETGSMEVIIQPLNNDEAPLRTPRRQLTAQGATP
jgi:crossover junction endodeoxyribonuclease RusA